MKLKLSNGSTGFHREDGSWQCTGSQMGRPNTLPADLPDGDWQPETKLRLVRVPFVDGDYDQGGAYWGSPANLYLATEGDFRDGILTPCGVQIFVRGNSRNEAKQAVRKLMPDAKFYR